VLDNTFTGGVKKWTGNMRRRLIFFLQLYIYSDGAFREMILWQPPLKTPDRPHGLKYQIYYGLGDGTCLLRFDNESGIGDQNMLAVRKKVIVLLM